MSKYFRCDELLHTTCFLHVFLNNSANNGRKTWENVRDIEEMLPTVRIAEARVNGGWN